MLNKDLKGIEKVPTHKAWLENEYNQWIMALQESTVHNFKEHPMVQRMLSCDKQHSEFAPPLTQNQLSLILKIDAIGRESKKYFFGDSIRMAYYALEILKQNPKSICEIGGGVGQFYAILRALGYEGEYMILDLKPVMEFQDKYLAEVHKQTGLNTEQIDIIYPDFVCSFYALGEFTDEKKQHYFNMVINPTSHGYIAWNPHSGATDDLSLFKHDIKVTPGIEPGIKIITW